MESTDELKAAYAEIIERINDLYSAHPHGLTGRAKQRVHTLQLQAFDLFTEISRAERWRAA